MQTADETRHDVSVLERVIAREAEAIAELYDRHSRLLYGLILRILGDSGEAEEVLQDVFVQVWKRAETFNLDLGTPVAWLVRIARNRAIDRLRANSVRRRTLETPPPLPSESPEARAAMTEQQRALARALDVLPAPERQLLEQAYFLGFTQSELAERFGLPLGTRHCASSPGTLATRRPFCCAVTSCTSSIASAKRRCWPVRSSRNVGCSSITGCWATSCSSRDGSRKPATPTRR